MQLSPRIFGRKAPLNVGASAGELIHEAIHAMKMKLNVTTLGSLIHVYPTLSQVNQQAALDALLRKLSPYRKPFRMRLILSFTRSRQIIN